MLALVLLAQQATDTPGWSDIVGPYGALAIAIGAICWLTRRLSESEKARADLVERLLAQNEKSIPLLERTAAALERREQDR